VKGFVVPARYEAGPSNLTLGRHSPDFAKPSTEDQKSGIQPVAEMRSLGLAYRTYMTRIGDRDEYAAILFRGQPCAALEEFSESTGDRRVPSVYGRIHP
jgi:hypothetical protein